MIDIMLDSETMGVGNSPALLQISAVQFDINTGEIGSTFDMKIDLQTSIDAGLDISAGTINFWMTNKDVTQEARENVLTETGDHKKGGNTLSYVLNKFSYWIKTNSIKHVWGHGSASDNVWIRSAYDAVQMEYPFNFREDMCYRTLYKLAKRQGYVNSVTREGIYHDGLDDAKHQVKCLMEIMKFLNVKQIDKS